MSKEDKLLKEIKKNIEKEANVNYELLQYKNLLGKLNNKKSMGLL